MTMAANAQQLATGLITNDQRSVELARAAILAEPKAGKAFQRTKDQVRKYARDLCRGGDPDGANELLRITENTCHH